MRLFEDFFLVTKSFEDDAVLCRFALGHCNGNISLLAQGWDQQQVHALMPYKRDDPDHSFLKNLFFRLRKSCGTSESTAKH